MIERGLDAGYELDGIHRHADPVAPSPRREAIFIGGGNTFRLLDDAVPLGLLDPIRARVRAGCPTWASAPARNVACPTIKTTNDMPIVQPPSLDALGLVPFQVNPHYFTGQTYVKSATSSSSTSARRATSGCAEFHEMNDTPVVGLWEAGMLRCEDGRVVLTRRAARVFRKGEPAWTWPPVRTWRGCWGRADVGSRSWTRPPDRFNFGVNLSLRRGEVRVGANRVPSPGPPAPHPQARLIPDLGE